MLRNNASFGHHYILILLLQLTTSWGGTIPLTVDLAVSYSVSSLQTVAVLSAGVGGRCIKRPVSRADLNVSIIKSEVSQTINLYCSYRVCVCMAYAYSYQVACFNQRHTDSLKC